MDDSRQNKELDIRKENLSKEVRDVHIGIGILILLMGIIIILTVLYIYRIKHHITSQYASLSKIRESENYIENKNQLAHFTDRQECDIETLRIPIIAVNCILKTTRMGIFSVGLRSPWFMLLFHI